MKLSKIIWLLLIVAIYINGCKPDPKEDDEKPVPDDWVYNPEPVQFQKPPYFPPPLNFSDNPLTKQGIRLGRMLFYDPILSGDSTQSCSSCHQQSLSFTDNKRYSVGIDGIAGNRNAMPLFNMAWQSSFFWDGRAATLEEQILKPVENPIEMHSTWPDVINRLSKHPQYPRLFYEAFGTRNITKEHASKAIAQFIRTMISFNSRYDKHRRGELFGTGREFTDEEQRGYDLFFANATATGDGADCFHCHGGELFADVSPNGQFRNNGLTETNDINGFPDKGRGAVTGNPQHNGLFKVPSLRNVALTAPYMHDGRFQTLDEVIEFYNSGVKNSPTLDPQMIHPGFTGLNLSEAEKAALKAFLLTLTDEEFVNNPNFSKPQ
jgi:cytochrome c peroxidase